MNTIDKALETIDERNYSPIAVEPTFTREAIEMVPYLKLLADQHKKLLNNKNASEQEKWKSYYAIKKAIDILR